MSALEFGVVDLSPATVWFTRTAGNNTFPGGVYLTTSQLMFHVVHEGTQIKAFVQMNIGFFKAGTVSWVRHHYEQ